MLLLPAVNGFDELTRFGAKAVPVWRMILKRVGSAEGSCLSPQSTDSRSFMSYPRHEYFRRVFCQMLGRDIARGALPDRPDYLSRLVADVCHGNGQRYFRLTPVLHEPSLR